MIPRAQAAAMPTLREALLAARRDPGAWRKEHAREPVLTVRSDGRVVALTVGPRGGTTRRVVGVVGTRSSKGGSKCTI